MRIKVLACAAALAAGALTSMAQSNVYSLNVVGYINLPLVDGFNLVANQLDADGTGTNNTIAGVFSSNLPPGAVVYAYNGASFEVATYAKNPKTGITGWSGSSTASLNPGQGAWISIPTGTFGKGVTQMVTTVGQVLQGPLSNPNIPAAGGFNLVSSQIPLAGGLQTTLGYNPQVGETFYLWDPTATAYSVASWVTNPKTHVTGWSPSEPTVAVGEGFWGNFEKGSTWSTNFTVGP